MDALGDLLDGVRARTAAFCRAVLEPPWALRIADEAPLALATALRGHAWIVPDTGQPVAVHTGEVAIVQGPAPYTVASDPMTAPTLHVRPGNRLITVDGVDVTAEARLSPVTSALSPRSGGETESDPAVIASGSYQVSGSVSRRLLDALPPIIVVPRDDVHSPIMDLMAAEVARDEPGQQVFLDRLLDLALIASLRTWFARPSNDPPGWYRAHSDALVGPALRTIHEDPAHQWTVASLAASTGSSRAAFARRFTALVGQPPMTYLTHWRIDLAADALRTSDATIASVARQVGYANAFALTVAFKRVRGITPRQYRSHGDPAASR